MLKHQGKILEKILSVIALIVAISIFLKAIFDIDTNYDVGWYQLPFAARIWGIVPESSFINENLIEHRFDGFPLLANFLQGLLWKITGHIQATNLVGYLSLCLYFLFLRKYFKVPLYLTVIAIFAIPTVLIHAATSFVDLPGNIGVAILIMMGCCFFQQSKLPSKSELFFTFLGAATAVNIKPQLQPLVFLIYWTVGIRLVWLYFRYTNTKQQKLWRTIGLAVIASVVIFATPIKNVALYGNPFYPIKIEIAGIELNHELTPDTFSESNRPQKWLRSILEINTPEWSADQWNEGDEKNLDRAGGFFGIYVIFNILLLLGLTISEQLNNKKLSSERKSRNATIALITAFLMSLVPANFPQSHELRYFMFWMITLVSLNLSLVTSRQNQDSKWLKPKYLGLICLLFMAITFIKIDSYYLRPVFNPLQPYLDETVKTELLQQMDPNERTCMIARHAIPDADAVPFAQIHNAFYYSSYFNSEISYDYAIQAVVDPKDCGDLKMIPANAQEFIDAEVSNQ